ncbi:MAG: AraC family transcriptional regulator [Oscillospiraceae bacterium]|nr:AraC family transcriptional regulator [Oscillospiraceae bacterium]
MQAVKENVNRGTPDFPLNVYSFKTDVVNVAYHWHPEIEMVYLEKGEFTITVNNESFRAASGDIILINGGELHAMNQNDGTVSFHSVVFYPQLLDFESKNPFQRSVLEPIKKGKLCMPRRLSAGDDCYGEVKKQFVRIIAAQKTDFPYAEQMIALYEILLVLYKGGKLFSSSVSCGEAENIEIIKKVLAYIDGHISEKLTLKALSDCANMSEKYFCSFFSRQAGCSPIEYVNRLRIEKACELLKTHKMSVTDTALETGFDSLSYFIRRFKRQMGLSPSQYKKQNLKNS